MWFTLSCQRRGRARDGEMRAATLSVLLSQLSHLDDSPPLSCSLCLTPHPPSCHPDSFLSCSHFCWVTARLPSVQNYFGRGILERVIVLLLFFFLSPVHFCHKLRTSHTLAMIMWLRSFRGQRFTGNASVCVIFKPRVCGGGWGGGIHLHVQFHSEWLVYVYIRTLTTKLTENTNGNNIKY